MKSVSSRWAGFGRLALIVCMIAGFLSLASPAQAQVYSTCDRWGQHTEGTWTIYNNIWGDNHGTQCLTVNSIKSWYVDANHSGGGIKSYPNTSVRPQTPLSQLNSAGFWYNTSSAPAAGSDHWNWTSDLWSTGNQDEIMVFTSWAPGPAGGWGRQIASNVTIGGILYASVWQADPGWNVLQLIPAQQSNTGTIDASAVWRWAASQNLLRNTTFDTMQFGLEITSTSGVQKRYSLNAYSAWWSNTSGGGSSI
ncbi:glycoside hydrolase family 12 protein [Streptomyces litchfieldiae]|uniref:Uncharacterized protein n=1 Tax=Streptomyces litchfieldiae TaxID=3075543 RepID=A0ABU2MWA9_9ACTN|nr:hypothetical protein [Streptomyces sp. DSM 44938]MDT0345935.1 hypothetical protein [Streptomyces sp. DSM 44938]